MCKRNRQLENSRRSKLLLALLSTLALSSLLVSSTTPPAPQTSTPAPEEPACPPGYYEEKKEDGAEGKSESKEGESREEGKEGGGAATKPPKAPPVCRPIPRDLRATALQELQEAWTDTSGELMVQFEVFDKVRIQSPETVNYEGYRELFESQVLLSEQLRYLRLSLEEAKHAFGLVGELRDEVTKFYELLQRFMSTSKRIQNLKRKLRLARQDVVISGRRNWRLGKEAMLYLFGFKWFWGLFTGWAPTTSTVESREAESRIKEQVGKELAHEEEEYELLLGGFYQSRSRLNRSFEGVVSKVGSLALKNKLTDTKFAVELLFTLALERFRLEQSKTALYEEKVFNEFIALPGSYGRSAAGKVEKNYLIDLHRQEEQVAKDTSSATLKQLSSFLTTLFHGGQPPVDQWGNTTDPHNLDPNSLFYQPLSEMWELENRIKHLSELLEENNRTLGSIGRLHPGFAPQYLGSAAPQTKLGALESWIKDTDRFLVGEEERLQSHQRFAARVLELRALAQELLLQLRSMIGLEQESMVARERVAIYQEGLQARRATGWSLLKELFLYVLGFKWLWGGTTGYAPTVSTSQQVEALGRARQEFDATQRVVEEELTAQRAEFTKRLKAFEELLSRTPQEFTQSYEKDVLARFLTLYADVMDTYWAAHQRYIEETTLLHHELLESHSNFWFRTAEWWRDLQKQVKFLAKDRWFIYTKWLDDNIDLVPANPPIPDHIGATTSHQRFLSVEAQLLKRFEEDSSSLLGGFGLFLANSHSLVGTYQLKRNLSRAGFARFKELLPEVAPAVSQQKEPRTGSPHHHPSSPLEPTDLTPRGSTTNEIIEVSSRAELEAEIRRQKGNLLVAYTLNTCPHCRRFRKVLQNLVKLTSIKVIDFEISAAIKTKELESKNITGVPFVEFYRNGKYFAHHRGGLSITQIKEYFA